MPNIPELIPAIVSDIDDNDVIVGEDIIGTGKTFKYSFKVLKEYFGASGGSGVTKITTKNDDILTGAVKLYTNELHISTDFNFVTNSDLSTLKRFSIVSDTLNILDENDVIVQSIDNDSITIHQSLKLKVVPDGDSDTMKVLVIDPVTGEVKQTPTHEIIDVYEVNQVGLGLLVSVGSSIARVDAGYVLADATDGTKVCIGFVKSITDDDNIVYQASEELDVFSGLVEGATYYLHTTAGSIINAEPANFKQPLGLALSATKLRIHISPLHLTGDTIVITTQTSIKVVTNNYPIIPADDAILMDGSSNAIRTTLELIPPEGREVRIKAIDSTNTCDIDPNGKTIDGSGSLLVVASPNSVTLKYSSNYGWAIL